MATAIPAATLPDQHPPTSWEPLPLKTGWIPAELKERPQWVCWQLTLSPDGTKPKKIPISPHTGRYASTIKPTTWSTYEQTLDHYEESFLDGIGFVFTVDDPYLGIDLDDCRDPNTGELSQLAQDLIPELNTYTEVSPSGTGLKAIFRTTAPIPPEGRRTANLELYSQGRYFTITGHKLQDFQQIRELNPYDIAPVNKLLESRPKTNNNQAPNAIPPMPTVTDLPPLPISDKQILRAAVHSKSGKKFKLLFNGSIKLHRGDHSAADLSLCRILAFWCGPRPELIDRLFRLSKLHRKKWDKPHYSNGLTYGEHTIQLALESQEHQYEWPFSKKNLA